MVIVGSRRGKTDCHCWLDDHFSDQQVPATYKYCIISTTWLPVRIYIRDTMHFTVHCGSIDVLQTSYYELVDHTGSRLQNGNYRITELLSHRIFLVGRDL